MSWIAVKDKLPETDGEYLIYVPWPTSQIAIAWFFVSRTCWILESGCRLVTHWQPLPPPPDVPGTPSSEKLRELAKTHSPPQEWYDEDLNPFEADQLKE
jgi:hypothetical protein